MILGVKPLIFGNTHMDYETITRTRWWFQIFFIFTPTWGRFPILTNIIQVGWNHQLAYHYKELIDPIARYLWW